MLGGVSSSVQGFTGLYSTMTRGEQRTQLTGKLVCMDCSVAEARKVSPYKYGNHLYQLQLGQRQAVMEVRETNHFTWLNHLTRPNIRVQGEDNLLRALTSQDHVRKDVTIAGLLLDAHTLNVQEITVHQEYFHFSNL
jgi:hypothetical protein